MSQPETAEAEAVSLYNELIRLAPAERQRAQQIAFRLEVLKRKQPSEPALRAALSQALRATGDPERAREEARVAYHQAHLLSGAFRRNLPILLSQIGLFSSALDLMDHDFTTHALNDDGEFIAAYRNAAFGCGETDRLTWLATEFGQRGLEAWSKLFMDFVHENDAISQFCQRQKIVRGIVYNNQCGYDVSFINLDSGIEVSEFVYTDLDYQARRSLEDQIDDATSERDERQELAFNFLDKTISTLVMPIEACQTIYRDYLEPA